jgi:hypothetical protein
MMIQSVTQYGGLIFLYILGTVCVGLFAFEILQGQQPSGYVLGYIGLVTIQISHSSGVNQGVQNTNDTVSKTANAQYQLTPEGREEAAVAKAAIPH